MTHCGKQLKKNISVARSQTPGHPLVLTEGDLHRAHVRQFTDIAPLPNEHQYRDLRVLQDSNLFGLSNGYKDSSGFIRQLDKNPPQLTVTLRNYQSQVVRWMLDQEAAPSIS